MSAKRALFTSLGYDKIGFLSLCDFKEPIITTSGYMLYILKLMNFVFDNLYCKNKRLF